MSTDIYNDTIGEDIATDNYNETVTDAIKNNPEDLPDEFCQPWPNVQHVFFQVTYYLKTRFSFSDSNLKTHY